MAIFTDVFEDVTKQGRKIPTSDYHEIGAHPIIDQGQSAIAGYTDETDGLFTDVPAIIFGDHTRVLKYVDTPCFLGADGVKLLKAKIANPNYKYLYYVLSNANIPNTGYNRHFKWLKEVNIPLPNVDEQQKIVDTLDKISELIALRKEQLAKLDQLVKSRFIELFGDCDNEVLIGDVISISRGASPRPISAFITDSEDGVNWIKIGDVSEKSLYITKTEEKITPEGAKKSRMVHKGDFILSNSMSFGRPYILGIDGCVHDGWLIMSDFKETFNELYLYHAIRSDDVQYQFSGKVNGATVKNLNSDLVKNTYIKVPSMELQKQFATFVEQNDKSKLVIQQSLDKLELLKKSLMQKYFG